MLGLAIAIVAAGAGLMSVALLTGPTLDTGRVPVILVHGFDSTPDSMGAIGDALRGRGREVVAVALPERGTGDVLVSARALDDAVAATGAAHVDLIAHSAGGVVVRSWLSRFGGEDIAEVVITLGSPHHGTELADLAGTAGPEACVDACAQLGRSSSFLADLNSDDETPGDISYTSIWTEFDNTVTPPDSAVLTGATNVRVQDVCPDSRLSHGDLVSDPLAIGIVIAVIESEPDVFGPSACSSIRDLGNTGLSS
jgi:triacylglycerol lipase